MCCWSTRLPYTLLIALCVGLCQRTLAADNTALLAKWLHGAIEGRNSDDWAKHWMETGKTFCNFPSLCQFTFSVQEHCNTELVRRKCSAVRCNVSSAENSYHLLSYYALLTVSVVFKDYSHLLAVKRQSTDPQSDKLTVPLSRRRAPERVSRQDVVAIYNDNRARSTNVPWSQSRLPIIERPQYGDNVEVPVNRSTTTKSRSTTTQVVTDAYSVDTTRSGIVPQPDDNIEAPAVDLPWDRLTWEQDTSGSYDGGDAIVPINRSTTTTSTTTTLTTTTATTTITEATTTAKEKLTYESGNSGYSPPVFSFESYFSTPELGPTPPRTTVSHPPLIDGYNGIPSTTRDTQTSTTTVEQTTPLTTTADTYQTTTQTRRTSGTTRERTTISRTPSTSAYETPATDETTRRTTPVTRRMTTPATWTTTRRTASTSAYETPSTTRTSRTTTAATRTTTRRTQPTSAYDTPGTTRRSTMSSRRTTTTPRRTTTSSRRTTTMPRRTTTSSRRTTTGERRTTTAPHETPGTQRTTTDSYQTPPNQQTTAPLYPTSSTGSMTETVSTTEGMSATTSSTEEASRTTSSRTTPSTTTDGGGTATPTGRSTSTVRGPTFTTPVVPTRTTSTVVPTQTTTGGSSVPNRVRGLLLAMLFTLFLCA